MSLDPVRLADTRAWLSRVASDLRAAELDFTAAPPLLSDIAFHCQQAVEKAFKAFLTWHDRPFRKTHDLREVGGQCVDLDPTLSALVDRAAPLTDYAWEFRYPGNESEPTEEEAAEAMALAREVTDAILARLPEEARV
jgi:HEPN domain-containing protein